MTQPLVECVPNFSDARRPEVIAAIDQAILSVPGVTILDHHSDLDHNRTVITFVGAPAAVEEAAFQAVAKAAQLINLDEHSGAHPRIGATDVLPFIPISGVTMEQCVQMAQRLGKRVGDELGIPVYLYEQAAARPERQNLENIRRGQYEGLKLEIESNPARLPDFGPARLGPAGATVIGARPFLVAFNVYLTTADVAIAEKIAKAIRHSSGGLRYVKALGLLVDGMAQVSMNLTDFRKTPLARVVEMIRREAGRYGVGVRHSELVGLIPEAAVVDAAVWYMQLDQFEPEQILERKLAAVSAGTEPASPPAQPDFLAQLGEATPTPGGGSAAAYSGGMAASLVMMVAGLTAGKKKYAALEDEMHANLERARLLQERFKTAVLADAQAFEDLLQAMRLPKADETAAAARQAAIQAGTLKAAQIPMQVAGDAMETLGLAARLVEAGNLNAISDAAAGAAFARAAFEAAALNVRINVAGLEDAAAGADLLAEVRRLEAQVPALQARVMAALVSRGGQSFA